MSPNPKAIGDGSIIDVGDTFAADERDAELDRLKDEIRRLKRAVSDAELKAERAHEDANRALGMLRRQLSPLFRALQAVFGELDAAGVTDAAAPSAPSAAAPSTDASKAKWDEWKQRLGNNCARVIDALLLGGEMNVKAIMVACRMGENTVYKATADMGRAGILVKNGGKFSLKALS